MISIGTSCRNIQHFSFECHICRIWIKPPLPLRRYGSCQQLVTCVSSSKIMYFFAWKVLFRNRYCLNVDTIWHYTLQIHAFQLFVITWYLWQKRVSYTLLTNCIHFWVLASIHLWWLNISKYLLPVLGNKYIYLDSITFMWNTLDGNLTSQRVHESNLHLESMSKLTISDH